MQSIWFVVGVGLVVIVGFVLILYVFQERLLYFPAKYLIGTPETIGLDYEDVQLNTEDGLRLSGWFVPAEGAERVVLFFHGNAGNISHRLESISFFNRLGLNVFIFDYRGYGRSEGQTTETGTYQDALAAWHYLLNERGFRADQVIFFGRSLGGAVAAWLAAHHPPRLIILESTFTSVPDMAARQFPLLPARWLARIQYNTLERLPQIEVPVLIIHSSADEIIPYSQGQRLFEAANQPKTFLEIVGGHNEGFLITGQKYEAGIAEFIARY